MNNQSYFMHFYMFELEVFLNSQKKNLFTVSFQSDEANTDRPLKEYLKSVIENELNMLPINPIANKLFIDDQTYSIDEYRNYNISRVILPDEIDENLKQKIKESKSACYTNPDICLEIKGNGSTFYQTVELKSTKNDSIPGSSIQQIIPDEWVIFVKHTLKDIEVVTGQYINSINSKMQFPDRSPRPQVSFKELLSWNNLHRNIENNELIYTIDDSLANKLALIDDWQGVLSKRWIDILLNSEKVKKSEPWFNNNIRKFILDFLEIYDGYSKEEKDLIKSKIQSMIKKETDD